MSMASGIERIKNNIIVFRFINCMYRKKSFLFCAFPHAFVGETG